jgi:predicted alpha-1,2-mannosidase
VLGGALAAAAAIGGCDASSPPPSRGFPAGSADLATLVNPFRGTQEGAPDQGTGGGAGNTFPGPVLPFGMIKLGPDTLPASKNFGGGYAYDDSRIRGFSLMRLSGAGCWGYRDAPITPTTAPITRSPVRPLSLNTTDEHIATFSHEHESAGPGEYRVTLNPDSTQPMEVELTTAMRTGLMRVRFPENAPASLLFNLGGTVTGVRAAEVIVNPEAREISGWVDSGDFCFHPNRYRLHFVARMDRPFLDYGTWKRQLLSPRSTHNSDVSLIPPGDLLPIPNLLTLGQNFGLGGDGADTAQTGAYLSFDTTQRRDVEVRVAVSFTSADNARANLDAETAGRSFEQVRAAARATWNDWLGRVAVEGGDQADRRSFYTALYHSLIHPTTFHDVNGEYLGMDGQVHHIEAGHAKYTDISGWDMYRAQTQWLALVAPEIASDLVRSMLLDARDSGWLPKWPTAGGHTGSMTGDPAAAMIASAYALGARDFDARQALAAMVKGGSQTGISPGTGYVERAGLSEYLALGYVPHERNANQLTQAVEANLRAFSALGVPGLENLALAWGSAGTTLEYASADFAIASLAAALGETQTCRDFLARSGNWRNVFDPSIGAMRPRWASGLWVAPFDPAFNDPFSSQGFAEGNGIQYTWTIPFNVAGLSAALGGAAATAAKLDDFFIELNAGFSSSHAFLSNEPSFYGPWFYNWLGRPARTQAVLRRALLELFEDGPGGYPGNEDLGTLASWEMFNRLGFYPLIPGQDVVALSAPLFPKVTLRRAAGDIVIEAPQATRERPYVQALTVNGRAHDRPWLQFADIADGGVLHYALGADPDSGWGTAADAAPPSFAPDETRFCYGSLNP